MTLVTIKNLPHDFIQMRSMPKLHLCRLLVSVRKTIGLMTAL
jgi:hypothetical protein